MFLLTLITFLLIPPITFLLLSTFPTLYQTLRYTLPPGPTPWPVLGNLLHIKPVRFRCFHEWARQYGPIISFRMGSKLNIVVSSSELAKQVLKEHDQELADRFRSRSNGRFSKNGKDLIWTDYGPYYVKVRKICTLHLFTQKWLEALRPIREDEVTAMVESLFHDSTNPENEGKPLVMKKYIETVSFNNITRLTYAKRSINSKGELDPFGKELKAVISAGRSYKVNFWAEHLPWFRWLMKPFDNEDKVVAMFNAQLDKFSRKIMDEHSKAKLQGGAKNHFVDALLSLKDEYDLSEDNVIGLLWDMIVAGIDTVAIVVEWALAELIRNPRVQKKAQEELDRVIGSQRVMTEEDFGNLPYLQAITKESLRLHPPTPLMLPHKAKSHVKIGGYDIPKGTVVHVNVWALGHDPDVFENAEEFRPERFLQEDIDVRGHDFRLLPFGAGRRNCPGSQLGITLVTSLLGHLLHHFEWVPPSGTKPEEIDMSEGPEVVAFMRTPLQAIPIPRLPKELYKRVSNGDVGE